MHFNLLVDRIGVLVAVAFAVRCRHDILLRQHVNNRLVIIRLLIRGVEKDHVFLVVLDVEFHFVVDVALNLVV